MYQLNGPDLDPNTRTNDASWNDSTDAAKNWKEITSRSTKTCEKSGESGVTCSLLNMGFERYFVTDSADHDIQFKESQQDTDFIVYGWAADRGRSATISADNTKTPQTIRAVSKTAIEQSASGTNTGAGETDDGDANKDSKD